MTVSTRIELVTKQLGVRNIKLVKKIIRPSRASQRKHVTPIADPSPRIAETNLTVCRRADLMEEAIFMLVRIIHIKHVLPTPWLHLDAG